MAPNRVDPAALVHQATTNPLRRLVPLGGGTHVYLFDPVKLRTLHLKTRSPEFAEALRQLCELGLKGRIRQELEEFDADYPDNKWGEVISLLEEAEVL
jgi:hypothetical protein